jgi:chromosome segregation ATPase
MSDANPSNIPPSQSNFSSANGDLPENWSVPISDENLEEQLLSLIELASSTDDEEQENSDDLEQQTLEERLFSLMETIDSFESSSPAIESETVELEASLVEADSNWYNERLKGETDWFERAYQLEEQNQELEQTILQLRQALKESQQQLQERSQSAEAAIAQQAEQLQQAQDQVARLMARLDASQQQVERQQLKIATLSQRLDFAQQQVARLEREYVLLQEDCNDKDQKLIAMEKHLRELWSRLHRQQRYALEYKAALEQYLGTSDARVVLGQASGFSLTAPLTSKVTAIEPWSSQQNQFPSSSEREANAVDSSLDDESLEEAFIMEIDASEVLEIAESDAETLNLNPNSQIANPPRPNWPSPIISSTQKPQAQGSVDLPSFLRNRRSG